MAYNENKIEFSHFREDFPYTDWVAVTPDDDNDLSRIPRSLYIGASGTVQIVSQNGNDVQFLSVPVGILRVQPARVKATGTSATDIIALY